MICGRSIRPLTPEEITERRNESQRVYRDMYDRVKAQHKEAHDAVFGERVAFQPDHELIHNAVAAMLYADIGTEFQSHK